jgi:hypothetical protein
MYRWHVHIHRSTLTFSSFRSLDGVMVNHCWLIYSSVSHALFSLGLIYFYFFLFL